MDHTATNPAQLHAMMAAMIPFILFCVVIGWAIVLVPFWQIFKKAGMTPALSLLMILPLVNLVMLYVLAFSRWNVIPAGPEYPPYPGAYPPPQPGYVPPTAYTAPPAYPPQQPPYVPPPTDTNSAA
jgi:Na+/proline symporter